VSANAVRDAEVRERHTAVLAQQGESLAKITGAPAKVRDRLDGKGERP
jgi:hypothetical protein